MSDNTCMVETAAGAGAVSQIEPERRQRRLEPYQQRLEWIESLFTQMADAVFVAGLDGQIIDVNPAACALLGYEKQELLRMRVWDFVSSAARDEILGLFSTMNPGAPVAVQRTYRCKNGEQKIVEVRQTRDDHGGRDLIVISSRDITEAARTRALLAGERRLLEMVAKGGPLGDILTALCRLSEELCSRSITSILLLEPGTRQLWHGAAPSLPREYIEAINGGVIGPSAGSCGTAAYRGEPVIVCDIASDPLWKDYRNLALPFGLRACWSMPIFSTDRKVLGTFAIYFREPGSPTRPLREMIERLADLASIGIERTRAQEDLRRNEAYLAEAQRASLTGSFGWNVSSGKLFWTDETFRILGYDRTIEPSLEAIFNRIHPDDIALVKQILNRGTNGEESFDIEHRLLMPDGSVKHVHAVGHATIGGPHGREFVGAVTEVTEHHRARAALERALSDLKKSEEARAELARAARMTTMGELAASIAHEVNQPLTAVVTNANAALRWLDRATPDLHEARQAVQRIVRDGIRGSEVIGRIRALMKREPPQRTLLNVNELVQEIARLAPVAPAEAALQLELAGALPVVPADRVQLQQVLLNLVTNALDALNTVCDRPRVVRIETKSVGNDAVLVTVRDTGVGLPPEKMEQLFNPFFTTKPDGLGMGLSISRSIVEGHGGRLWAEPNDAHGATFRFTLPTEKGGVT